MTASRDDLDRGRFVGTVRRTFGRAARLQRVGFVGANELHNVGCPDYQEATVWPEPGREAISMGSLESVFKALLDDFVEGAVPFPHLHDCLRKSSVPPV